MGSGILATDITAVHFVDVIPDVALDFTTGQTVSANGIMMTCGRATAAMQFGPQGRLETVPANVARFKRHELTGKIMGLLAEPTATNQLERNKELSNPVFIKQNAAITLGAVDGIDGCKMFKLTETNANSWHSMNSKLVPVSDEGWLSASIYVKAGERRFAGFELGFKPSSLSLKAVVNLSDGSYTLSGPLQGYMTVTPCVDGIYRLELSAHTTEISADGITGRLTILAHNGETVSYPGVEGSGIYIQYPQLEASPRATSTIITADTTATRNADNYTLEPRALRNFGPQNWTLFAEAIPTMAESHAYASGEVSPAAVSLRNSKATEQVVKCLLGRNTASLAPYMFNRGSAYLQKSGNTAWKTGKMKLAANSEGTFAYSGIVMPTDDFTPDATADTLQIGSAQPGKEYFEGYVVSIRLYLRPLSDLKMKTITQ
ncbi:MAG: phage head spike fiber domain-containing protein [Serratia sp. (in: enterobacteria)]